MKTEATHLRKGEREPWSDQKKRRHGEESERLRFLERVIWRVIEGTKIRRLRNLLLQLLWIDPSLVCFLLSFHCLVPFSFPWTLLWFELSQRNNPSSFGFVFYFGFVLSIKVFLCMCVTLKYFAGSKIINKNKIKRKIKIFINSKTK